MLPNPAHHPSSYPYDPFMGVWNDISRLFGMDADDLLWMSRVC